MIQELDKYVSNLNQIDSIQQMKSEAEQKKALRRHHKTINSIASKLTIGKENCKGGQEYVVLSSYTYPCPQAIPDLQFKLSKIARKVPTLGAMEHKIGLMNTLDPELKSLEKDLNEITDFSDMKAAKVGGQKILEHLNS